MKLLVFLFLTLFSCVQVRGACNPDDEDACNLHGVCISPSGNMSTSNNMTTPYCVCDEPYTGDSCNKVSSEVDTTNCQPADPQACSDHGICQINFNSDATYCDCDDRFIGDECDYEQKSKLTAFLLGLFVGYYGADRFYLGYVDMGIGKLVLGIVICCAAYCLICGVAGMAAGADGDSDSCLAAGGACASVGCCLYCVAILAVIIWWIYDWASILSDTLPDAKGYPLYNDM